MTPTLSLLSNALGMILAAETLPLLLEMLILSIAAALPLHQRRPLRPRQPVTPVKLAVIVPAHNEEHLIGECVRSLLGAEHEKRQSTVAIYVVAHNCFDNTEGRAKAAGAQVLTFTNSIASRGMALDFGFRHAIEQGADAVLVVNANSVAGPGLIQRTCDAFASGAQAVQCKSQVATGGVDKRTRIGVLTQAGVSLVRPLGRARLGLSCGLFGNGFGVTSKTLACVPYSTHLLEEPVEYHLQLVQAKIRVQFLSDVAVFSEPPEPLLGTSSQRTTGEVCRLVMRRAWSGPLLLGLLRGQVAQLEPLLDLLALPLTVEAALFILMLLLGQVGRSASLTGYAVVGLSACTFYLCTAALLPPARWLAIKRFLPPALLINPLLMPVKPPTETR